MPVQTHWQDTCSANLRPNLRPDLHPGADSVPLGGNTHRLSEARLPLPAPPPAPGSPDLPAARLQPSICRADHTALCALLYASRLDMKNVHSLQCYCNRCCSGPPRASSYSEYPDSATARGTHSADSTRGDSACGRTAATYRHTVLNNINNNSGDQHLP